MDFVALCKRPKFYDFVNFLELQASHPISRVLVLFHFLFLRLILYSILKISSLKCDIKSPIMSLKKLIEATMEAAEISMEAFRKMFIVEAMIKLQDYNLGHIQF